MSDRLLPSSTSSPGETDPDRTSTSVASDGGNLSGETVSHDAPRLDLGGGADSEDRPVAPTCATITDFNATSIGCEFWAIDMPILGRSAGRRLGIGVGNPGDVEAIVTIEDLRGPGRSLRTLAQVVLRPDESSLVTVNDDGGQALGENSALVPGLNQVSAFRVTSSHPITAMQIKPVGGAASMVPEASMLLPTNGLDGAYLTAGYAASSTDNIVVAVAVQDATTVTTNLDTVMLDAFDAYMWTPDDAMGFFVGADAPIAVFSGAVCVEIPEQQFWCDHIEEQMIPLSAWGTQYVGARHPPRVVDENQQSDPVLWRVVAAQAATTVTLTPDLLGGPIELDHMGDYVEFWAEQSFVAQSAADKPFMVVQFMSGGGSISSCPGGVSGVPVGDPYMMQMVPVDQWISELPFLTDSSYVRDFVVIARPVGTETRVRCLGPIPEDHFTPIVGTSYEVGWVDLDSPIGGEGSCVDGQQFVSADAPVGVQVGGVDCAASYGYPGGLSLDALWTPPTVPAG